MSTFTIVNLVLSSMSLITSALFCYGCYLKFRQLHYIEVNNLEDRFYEVSLYDQGLVGRTKIPAKDLPKVASWDKVFDPSATWTLSYVEDGRVLSELHIPPWARRSFVRQLKWHLKRFNPEIEIEPGIYR